MIENATTTIPSSSSSSSSTLAWKHIVFTSVIIQDKICLLGQSSSTTQPQNDQLTTGTCEKRSTNEINSIFSNNSSMRGVIPKVSPADHQWSDISAESVPQTKIYINILCIAECLYIFSAPCSENNWEPLHQGLIIRTLTRSCFSL